MIHNSNNAIPSKKWSKKNPTEWVLLRPHVYAGSMKKREKKDWMYNIESKFLYKGNTEIPNGLERLFWEIITNASDNCMESISKGVDSHQIEVYMDEKLIRVRNYGMPISVVKNDEGNYIPYMIFGELYTSSNYEDDESSYDDDDDDDDKKSKKKQRKGAGMNGVGAKLINILSTYFKVTVKDAFNKKSYSQIWTDNMKSVHPYELYDYDEEISYVEIEFECDFKRFGYEKYTQDIFELYARHCLTISATCKTPVFFNGQKFQFNNILELSEMYFPSDKYPNRLSYFKWPIGTELVNGSNINTKFPLIEIVIIDSPDKGEVVSYVNSMITRDGGSHVNAIWNNLGKLIIKNVYKKMNFEKKTEKLLTLKDIKNHLTILCFFNDVPDPEFDSQSKKELTDPVISYFSKDLNFDDEFISNMNDWEIYEKLIHVLTGKINTTMKLTDGKRIKNLFYDPKEKEDFKGSEADLAGSENLEERMSTIFYVVEGDSAETYIKSKTNILKYNHKYGYYPLGGKGLNTMKNKNIKRLLDNKKIKQIKRRLGLVEGTDYTIDKNFNELRYGHFRILADSDVDGYHIIGLVILYLFCYFPSLLKRGFVSYEKAPLIRAIKKKSEIKRFYSKQEYDLWKTYNETKGWKISYYKGLGGFSDQEIRSDLKFEKVIKLVYDEKATETIELAFSGIKGFSERRKQWILERNIVHTNYDNIKEQTISDFINNDLINYSIYTLERAIPKLLDGLKLSHRQILYAAFKYFGSENKKDTKFKIKQFAGYIAETCDYEHGETSLEKTIVKLAQGFAGTNNTPLLSPVGQLGNRNDFKPAASRYVHVKSFELLSKIFKTEDLPLLTPVIGDEEQELQPEFYLPIIPIILCNGTIGIATGSSSGIPNFNPIQIIDWMIQRINDVSSDEITDVDPWCLGYTGKIHIVEKKTSKRSFVSSKTDSSSEQESLTSDDMEENSESLNDILNFIIPEENKKSRLVVNIYGDYVFEDDNIVITEIPYNMSFSDYKNKLIEMRQNKKIKDFVNQSSGNNKPRFVISGFKERVNHKNLGLISSISMSNMVLINNRGNPVRFETQYEILENFYEQRLPFYYKRKEFILNKMLSSLNNDKEKRKFMQIYLDSRNKYDKMTSEEIENDLVNHGFDLESVKKLLSKINLYSIAKDKILSFDNEIERKEKEYNEYSELSPEKIWIDELVELKEGYKKYIAKMEKEYNKVSHDDLEEDIFRSKKTRRVPKKFSKKK